MKSQAISNIVFSSKFMQLANFGIYDIISYTYELFSGFYEQNFPGKKFLDFTSKMLPDSTNQIFLHRGDMMHDVVDDCSVLL